MKIIEIVVLRRTFVHRCNFNKIEYFKLLLKVLNSHPDLTARESALILLCALDQIDFATIGHSLINASPDENLKTYYEIGFRLVNVNISEHKSMDIILKLLKSESILKTSEILKLLTEYAMNERIDSLDKIKILDYLIKEADEIKSKGKICEIKLESEFYKAWIKIQGFSGKSEYKPTYNNSCAADVFVPPDDF